MWSDESNSLDSQSEDSYDEIDSDEINECKFSTKHDGTYDKAENISTPAEVEELKKREHIMNERNSKRYYCSKLDNCELYDAIMSVYKRFVQPDMMKQV